MIMIDVLINCVQIFQRIVMKVLLFQPKCLILTRFLKANDRQKDHIILLDTVFFVQF